MIYVKVIPIGGYTTTTTTTPYVGEETTTTIYPETTTTTTTVFSGQGTKVYPYSFSDFRTDFPNVSASPTSDLSDFGVYTVYYTPKPSDNTKNYTEELNYSIPNARFENSWIATDKTESELKAMKSAELSNLKRTDMRKIQEDLLLEQSQLATTLDEVAMYQNLYPLWEDQPDGFQFTLEFKVNYIDSLIALRLFRCIQAHAKQANFNPVATPALWSEIILNPGGIEVWTQPIGGDNKYPYIDPLTSLPYKVTYSGFTWENNYQAGLNVWVPGEFGWTQL